MALIALILAISSAFIQSAGAPVPEGPRALTRDSMPRFGEQAELCGRAIALQCTDHFPRILIDIAGRRSRYVVAVPDWMRPDVAARFDASYLAHEVCATGAYTGYGLAEGIELANAGDLAVVAGPARPLTAFETPSASACEDGVTLPVPFREVRPSYTSDAMKAKVTGAVLIEGIVLPDGSVGETRLLRSLDPAHGLDDEAVKAFRQWRFNAGTRNGEPAAVRVTAEMTFTLR